jgi:F0F1-type ATP synthase assembly protein I
MRDAETKWAKRSAWAFLIFLVVIGIIAGVIIGVMRSS